jgi:hypothetical protein
VTARKSLLTAEQRDLIERKRRSNAWTAARHVEFEDWKARGYQYPPPPKRYPPAEFYAIPCAAKTRAGTTCKRTDIYANGRCKFHGGLSTGPRSAEGIERAKRNLEAGRKRREPHEELRKVNTGER